MPIKAQILRNFPGLRRYYASIARLDAERIAALSSLEQAHTQLTEERDRALALARDWEAERDSALAQARAQEAERDAAIVQARARETERDAALALARAHEAERDAALALTPAHEKERNAALAPAREAEFGALRHAIEDYVNLILQRLAGHQDTMHGKLDNLAASILSVSSRADETASRLIRQLGGQASGRSDGRAADLYLDLLEASLTGLLTEDASDAPWTQETFDPHLRSIGRDWPEHAVTMIGTARMRNLRMLTTRALEEGVPGDFIETGVWRGGACIYAKGIFEAYGAQDRKVFVADSFRGLPEPDAAHNPADAGDIHYTYTQLAVSREAVAGNFRRYGLLDEQVVFLEGWFKDTLPAAPIERLAVLRLDGDMYESTMDALNALYHKVSPGGFVIVDDYVLEPCARAIRDFREQHGIEAPMEPVDGAAVWWRVPA